MSEMPATAREWADALEGACGEPVALASTFQMNTVKGQVTVFVYDCPIKMASVMQGAMTGISAEEFAEIRPWMAAQPEGFAVPEMPEWQGFAAVYMCGEFSPAVYTAVLAHELRHIRENDLEVNNVEIEMRADSEIPVDLIPAMVSYMKPWFGRCDKSLREFLRARLDALWDRYWAAQYQ